MARPGPNLGSGAHAAGISEAKGAQPSGRSVGTPSGRAQGSVSPSVATDERRSDDRGQVLQAPGPRTHVEDRRELCGRAQRTWSRSGTATAPRAPGCPRRTIACPDDAIAKSTGKTWDEWFPILDAWGAREKTHTEIARYVSQEHGVPGWWSQIGDRRLRAGARDCALQHERPDGFSVTASARRSPFRSSALFEAFVDDVRARVARRRLDVAADRASPAAPRASTGRTARRGSHVGFDREGRRRSASVAVAHERLPDADEAETAKARWRARLVGPQARSWRRDPAGRQPQTWVSTRSNGRGIRARSTASTRIAPVWIFRPLRVPMNRRSCSARGPPAPCRLMPGTSGTTQGRPALQKHRLDNRRARGADQLVLEVRVAHQEAETFHVCRIEVRAEAGAFEARPGSRSPRPRRRGPRARRRHRAVRTGRGRQRYSWSLRSERSRLPSAPRSRPRRRASASSASWSLTPSTKTTARGNQFSRRSMNGAVAGPTPQRPDPSGLVGCQRRR